MKAQKARTIFNPKGAGRPKLPEHNRGYVLHRTRPSLPNKTPVHVTIKLSRSVKNMRNKAIAQVFKRAVLRARTLGLSIVHFSLQKNHLHLFIEAPHRGVLSRGMQSFGISFAKGVKVVQKLTDGPAYHERYHSEILHTVTQVRNALAYILRNGLRHGQVKRPEDPYSSAALIERPEILFELKLNFLTLFETEKIFAEYKQNLEGMLAPPQFWLSKKVCL